MAKLQLTMACQEYDRTTALFSGLVQPEGIDLNVIKLGPEEIFWRQLQNEEFDICEFSNSSYFILRARGDDRFISLPVFVSRKFRHSEIWINKDAGIKSPQDLKGKAVGVPDYTMTATVFIRGMLQHEYGVNPTDIHWYYGGQDTPGREQRIATPTLPKELKLEKVPHKTLSDMLEKGEISAMIGARAPKCFREGSPKIGLLFPDYMELEKAYFKKTGIYPIMHNIVIRKAVLDRYPWVAQSLYKAFCEAKDICQQAIPNTTAPVYMLPWLIPAYEEAVEILGQDYWPYGIEPNRKTLEALALYVYEQGLAARKLDIDEVYISSVPYKI
ncbi:MAG TPA: PhnD/SsuA/transferrin family substrate-binding protein [Clostridia bacterium]|nr:PhnD/SsuA/transferrin family substrate-binding protein [Clostridia bacterium]